MIIAIIDLKWDEFRQATLNWWNKRRNDRFIRVNRVRERSIRILQNRYGYTKDQATYQLDKYYPRAWLG
jgi:hypothetical protein